jgi:ABC-type nitrate/sulfonate/bicarbonate transport system substrate-binding protein
MVQGTRYRRLLVVFLAAVGLVAGGGRAQAQASTQPPRLIPLNVGVASMCSCWLTLYVADAQGLFKAEGLDAKITTFSGGSQSMAALASGDVQIAGGAGVRGVTARLQGLDTIAIFAQTDGFYLQLMAVKPGLRTLQDLKGQRVTVRPGALSDQFLRFLLQRAGLTGSVQIVGTPTEQAELALVQTHAVDAVMTNEPNATVYLEKKLATPMINFNNTDELKAQGLGDLVPSHTLTYLAREKWLALPGSADTARRFVAAMQKAMEMIRQNPEIAVQTWGKLGAGASMSESGVISDSVRTTVRIFSKNGCLTQAGMANIQKVSAATGDLKKTLPFDQLATDKYFPAGVCQ